MPRVSPVKTVATFEDYVRFETTSDVRHEFVDGNLFVKAGGLKRHNFVANRILIRLFDVAIEHGCYAYSSDVITKMPSGKGYYPDVLVTCDSSLDTNRVVYRPNILIEVLSQSTEAIDRGEKWEQYQTIPSLEQYLLLSQNEPVAEVFSRTDNKWLYERFTGDAKLKFASLELEIVLSDFYKNLPIEELEES
jgi:Uma2 family endonuclease